MDREWETETEVMSLGTKTVVTSAAVVTSEVEAPVFIPRRLSITDDSIMIIHEDGVMEDISEVVPRQFLNCGLCNDELQEPKLLPCLHSFCCQCLQAYMRNNGHLPQQHSSDVEDDEVTNTFACPECGTPAPALDPERLPDNILAHRLSGPAPAAAPRDAAHCASCQQQGRGQVSASIHCANCEEYLCPDCAEAHSVQVETASHKVEPLPVAKTLHTSNRAGEAGGGDEGGGHPTGVTSQESTENSSNTGLRKCCQCYDSYDIDAMFCVDCDLALCADCHEAHEPSHKCAELSAVAQNFTAKIQAPVEELKRDSQTLTLVLVNLDRADRYTAKLHRDVQTRVKRRTKILCGLIREYESVLLQEVDRRSQHNVNTIQERRVAATQHAASLTAVTELTDKLLQFGSEEEKVALRRKVGRRVRELCEAELPLQPLELLHIRLNEPSVNVETICNLFGDLRSDVVHSDVRRKVLASSLSLDSLLRRSSSDLAEDMSELTELDEGEETSDGQGHDANLLSSSDRSDVLNAEKRKALQNETESSHNKSAPSRRRHSDSGLRRDHIPLPRVAHRHSTYLSPLERQSYGTDLESQEAEPYSPRDKADTSNSSFQSSSSVQESIPTQLLETPCKEIVLPEIIMKDNIKGVGVNSRGDLIVATVSTGAGASHKNAAYILEQHGIVRGQIPIKGAWNIHSVSADGKVALIVARGDNRFKLKVLNEDGSGAVLADIHLESLGVNFATADSNGNLLVASSRYTALGPHGKTVKPGGNVAIYDSSGHLQRRLTNEDITPTGGAKVLEKPHWIAMDHMNNIFVADCASHSVVGLTPNGELLFRLSNSDMEGEDLYQGPDSLCVDRRGHIIVTDKREGRVDVLNYHGQLLKSLFPAEPVRCVCVTPDNLLLVVPTEGNFKCYEYL